MNRNGGAWSKPTMHPADSHLRAALFALLVCAPPCVYACSSSAEGTIALADAAAEPSPDGAATTPSPNDPADAAADTDAEPTPNASCIGPAWRWQTSEVAMVEDVRAGAGGEVYVVGSVPDSLKRVPFIRKLTATGTRAWETRVTANVQVDGTMLSAAPVAGGVIVGGRFNGPIDTPRGTTRFGGPIVAKLDDTGAFVWASTAGSNDVVGAVEMDGNIVVSSSFGAGVLRTGRYDATSGELLGTAVYVDSVVTGRSRVLTSGPNDAGRLFAEGYWENVARPVGTLEAVDRNGNVRWEKPIPGATIHALANDGSGASYALYESSGRRISSYDANGNERWTKDVTGATALLPLATGVGVVRPVVVGSCGFRVEIYDLGGNKIADHGVGQLLPRLAIVAKRPGGMVIVDRETQGVASIDLPTP